MSVAKKRTDFLESEEGIQIRESLTAMASDITYNTSSSYNSNNNLYPDNVISFVDKHMNYICSHPNLDPRQYLANLRLMSRVNR